MKILHICLGSAFTEGMSYQDNLLSNQNAKDGHEVTLITDCHKFVDGKIVYTPPEDRVFTNGIHFIRLEYKKIINNFISGKIRCVPALYSVIEQIVPDVILFHGVAGWELLTVAKYKKNHTNIRLYLDSHEDFHNSGTNIISRIVQYRWFNKYLTKKVIPYTEKVLCISFECFDFLKQLYGFSDDIMEFYPLGGVVFDENIRLEKRDRIRKELLLKEDDILLIHSGKMDKLKKTDDLLKAFIQVPESRLKLVLIGSMDEATKIKLEPLILLDNRIKFLGWKAADELMEYLCACDLYVQPGGQSATMQNALCCGTAVAAYPHESHKYLLKDSVFYIDTTEDMKNIFEEILNNQDILKKIQYKGCKVAQEVLDYRILAKRIYR